MPDESSHYSFRCHPDDDADIIDTLDAASRLERSRLIKRLIRAGMGLEAINRIMPNGGLTGKIELSYENDPDVSQSPNSHFHPAPKPGAKK